MCVCVGQTFSFTEKQQYNYGYLINEYFIRELRKLWSMAFNDWAKYKDYNRIRKRITGHL